MKNRKGFTLMELMIVIAIIMLLAGAIVGRIGSGTEKAKIAKANAELQEIATALRAFRMDVGCWPRAGDPSLGNYLLNTPPVINAYTDDNLYIDIDPTKWRGPYLEATTMPVSPWANWSNYHLVVETGADGSVGYYVVCDGPDCKAGTDDDIKVLVQRFK